MAELPWILKKHEEHQYVSEASSGGHTLIFEDDRTLLPTVLVVAAQPQLASPVQAESFPVK